MSEALALNNVSFNTKVKASKKEVLKVLEKRTEKAKLELLKKGLSECGLEYDDSINDYHKFIKSLRESLKDVELSMANQIIDNLEKEIDSLIGELKQGSTTAFTKFVEKCNKIILPVKDVLLNSLAASGLITLTPTAIGKLGVGVALTGISAIKILKNDKYKRVTNKTYELNRILQDLEITKDKKGNYTDTRFNEQIQKNIRDFLEDHKIIYEDTGYISLRDAIYSLDNDKKEELCKIINNIKGDKINLEERLRDVNHGLLSRLKNKYIKPVSLGLASGVGLATSINAIDPALIAASVNGTILGKIVDGLSKSKVLSWISGIAGGALSTFGKYIPVVGELINKALAIENIGLLAIGGAGIGLLGAVGKNIYQYIKKKKNLFNTQKDMQKLQELDFKLYGNDDIKEIQTIKEKLAKKDCSQEEFIINIVCEYMDELGIKYEKRPKNKEELENLIKGLSNKDKRSVYILFSSLEDYLHREPNKFKRGIKKIGRAIKITAVLGLSSISVMELLGAGALVSNIKTKLFGDRYKVPERIAEFNDSIGTKAYKELHPEKDLTPRPGNTPRSMETPKPKPTMEPFNGSPSVIRPNVTESIYHALPQTGFDVNTILFGQTSIEDGIGILSKMSGEELYNSFLKAQDVKFATQLMEKLPEETFGKLKSFMETSEKIDRSQTGYLFLKNNMKMAIKNKNAIIEKVIDKIENARKKEEFVDKATKYTSIPLTAVGNLENQKTKG